MNNIWTEKESPHNFIYFIWEWSSVSNYPAKRVFYYGIIEIFNFSIAYKDSLSDYFKPVYFLATKTNVNCDHEYNFKI